MAVFLHHFHISKHVVLIKTGIRHCIFLCAHCKKVTSVSIACCSTSTSEFHNKKGKATICQSDRTKYPFPTMVPYFVALMLQSDVIASCTYILWPQEVSITKTTKSGRQAMLHNRYLNRDDMFTSKHFSVYQTGIL